MTSLREEIIKKFRLRWKSGNYEYVNGGAVEKFAMELGYKASNASRRLREMESGKLSDGRTCPIVLEKKEEKSVSYRYKPNEKELLSAHMNQHIKTI